MRRRAALTLLAAHGSAGRRRYRALDARAHRLIFIVWMVVVLAAGCGNDGGDGRAKLFEYDKRAPSSIRTELSVREPGVRVTELTYRSPRGGRVPAILIVPDGDGPFAGLIVQHGLPGRAADFEAIATDFARLGAVVIAIDAPFARRPSDYLTFTERDRADQIQLIVDLRRAVDLLEARDDVDGHRIGYLGFSYGAAMGGLLAGVEDRIAAFVLASGDGELVSNPHFTGPLSQLPADRRQKWLATMKPLEPLRWIGRASAPILFLSGRRDESAPPRAAKKFEHAAPAPKEVRWYDSGHILPDQAICDAARWLQQKIAIAGDKHPACG